MGEVTQGEDAFETNCLSCEELVLMEVTYGEDAEDDLAVAVFKCPACGVISLAPYRPSEARTYDESETEEPDG